MKSFKVLLAVFILTACGLAVISVMEIKRSFSYKAELDEGREKLDEVKQIKKQSEQIQQEIDGLREEEIVLEAKLSNNFDSPLPLIRIFTFLANEAGLTEVYFEYLSDDKVDQEKEAQAPEELQRLGDKVKSRQKKEAAPVAARVKPMFFSMECQGEYPQLCDFVEKLFDRELIVTIEKILISRSGEILPRQQIKMTLATYTYR